MNHPDLEKLWKAADAIPRAPGRSGGAAFEPIGLILSRPLQCSGYHCTPANTLSFAWTGSDGVHFSFVLRDGEADARSPVVMTVPMADRSNIIVGSDLREFLALGVGIGFFALDDLSYKPDALLARYPVAAEEFGEEEQELLGVIASTFGVEPWSDPKRRLEELRAMEALLQPPAPVEPPREKMSPVAFWEAQLERERGRPEGERNRAREAHMEEKLRRLRG